jgi:hypothetical protein
VATRPSRLEGSTASASPHILSIRHRAENHLRSKTSKNYALAKNGSPNRVTTSTKHYRLILIVGREKEKSPTKTIAINPTPLITNYSYWLTMKKRRAGLTTDPITRSINRTRWPLGECFTTNESKSNNLRRKACDIDKCRSITIADFPFCPVLQQKCVRRKSSGWFLVHNDAKPHPAKGPSITDERAPIFGTGGPPCVGLAARSSC